MSEHLTDGGLSYARDGDGPGVVLVHGWCCDRSYLAAQHDALSRRHTAVSLDLRGHGASAAPDEPSYTVADFADDVAAVAQDAGLVTPTVIGHSLGGLVALECAARGLVSSAILLDPAPVLDERGKAYFARSRADVASDADGSWRRQFAERIMLPGDRVRRDEIIAGIAASDRSVAAATMQGMADYDAAAGLAAVQGPLLLISATHPEDLSPIRAACPTLVTGQVVGAGHFLQVEVPDQVNPMIDRFLAMTSR